MRRKKISFSERPVPSPFHFALMPDILLRKLPEWLLRVTDSDFPGLHLLKDPEKRISIELAKRMRAHALKRTYRGVFTTIPNEGHSTPLLTFILRCMGMVPGVTDWVFMWPIEGGRDGGWIEIKRPEERGASEKTGKEVILRPAGTLSKPQRHFREWCLSADQRHAVCYSADEAEEKLREWGAL